MSDSSDPLDPRNALVPSQPSELALDAHGFDPADYQWVPVLRKPRADGWTPQRQVDFIAALSDTGSVTGAAKAVGMSVQSCYRLRRAPGAENFAAAWDAALQQASKRLADIAFDRAINGVEEPVLDKEGRCVYVRTRYNDRLLMFLMRAHQPERYRHAHQSLRQAAEPPPPLLPPAGEAIRALEPAAPAEPHLLMPPDALEDALACADILDGKLPHWHRGRDAMRVQAAAPLGEEFEQRLAAAKSEAGRLLPRSRAGEEKDEGEDKDKDDGWIADEIEAFWA